MSERGVKSSDKMDSTDDVLRIVLLGKDFLETSKLGNFILGRSAFDTKASPDLVEQHSQRATGQVEGRNISLINTPHLLHPQVSAEQSLLHFRECMSLCAPGPHIFLLVVESESLPKNADDRITSTLGSYSPLFMKHTIILISGESSRQHAARENVHQDLYLAIGKSEQRTKEQVLKLLEKIDEVVMRNRGEYLPYNVKEETKQPEQKKTKGFRMSFRSKPAKELIIVLLGMNELNNNIIGNFILGRDVFETEVPSVEQQSKIARGQVEGRCVALINTPHLLHPHLSVDQIMLRIEECMSLAVPGPHALLLALQHCKLTKADKDRMKSVLRFFGEKAFEYTIALTSDTQKHMPGGAHFMRNQQMEELIKKCAGGHYIFGTGSSRADLLKVIVKLAEKRHWKCLQCSVGEESTLRRESRRWSKETLYEMTRSTEDIEQASEMLNMVLCGSDAELKASISDLLVGQRQQSKDPSSVCVKRVAEVSEQPFTLVEMPTLYKTHLSEEQVMQQTLHCISLCPPGVHAFLFVMLEGRLTDEDKAEMEIIQRIFSSRVLQHTIVLINQKSQNRQLDETLKPVVKACAGSPLFFGPDSQVVELIEGVQALLRKNGDALYNKDNYLSAQVETLLKYKREAEDLQKKITYLTINDSKHLKIILLGKTGAGKSASGNTILGQEDLFTEDISGEPVTRACQKETGKIDGRLITVIDTPGLTSGSLANTDRNKIVEFCPNVEEGSHVFLLTIPIGRYLQDPEETLKSIQDMFGNGALKYTMVLFTRGDELKKRTIDQYAEKAGRETKELIRKCGNRYHVFNNSNHTDRDQVTTLLDKIESMVENNRGSCYTNKMYQQVEKEREEESELDEESEIMMKNVEMQKQQQLLWYQNRMNYKVDQEDDQAKRLSMDTPVTDM